MNKFGRRWALAVSLLLAAFSCIAGGFFPQGDIWLRHDEIKEIIKFVIDCLIDWITLITILFLTGKLGVTSAYSTLFVYTAEMLPTVIRSFGVGISSTVALFGATMAPFVPLLVRKSTTELLRQFSPESFSCFQNAFYRPLPLLLFGSVTLIAGLLATQLPETLGHKLPDTVSYAIIFHSRICLFLKLMSPVYFSWPIGFLL